VPVAIAPTLLLLALVTVVPEEIVADYELSNLRLRAFSGPLEARTTRNPSSTRSSDARTPPLALCFWISWRRSTSMRTSARAVLATTTRQQYGPGF